MVKSKLDSNVTYAEERRIDPEDEEYDAPAYELQILDYVVEVGLGKAKYAQIEKNLVYYPVYLAEGHKVVGQIGVIETLDSNLPNVLDSEGDPDLSLFNEPLLYSFVNEELLEKTAAVLGTESKVADRREEEEVAEKKEDKMFDASTSKNWVQKFFRDHKYHVVDNEGGGDCFFAVIRDALATIGKTITVAELRNRLSGAATEEMYKERRRLYEHQLKELESVKSRINVYKDQIKNLKAESKAITNRQEKAAMMKQAKDILSALKAASEEKAEASALLDEFKWIAKLTSFPKFVKAIRTCSFWADDWAVSAIEPLFNIKVIVLSEENYDEGDLNNVLQCGQGDKELLRKGLFRPTDYIIALHTGSHYKLVMYGDKGAFTFNELPKDLVNEIKQKCLERNAGLYAVIPEFKEGLEIEDEVVEEPSDLQLHGDLDVFQFYDAAADKPKPGKGSGESLGPEGLTKYTELKGDWRRKLSHGYVKPFKLDGKMWQTVDHFVEAQKFKNNPEVYEMFSMTSGSELSKDAEMARAAGAGKKYKGKLVLPKGAKPNPDWDEEMERKAKEEALMMKFTDEELANILKLTKDAKLMLYQRGKPARVEVELMRVRRNI
jgi:predicted NAD-dependent protein-ADP-ribosyltransferase YbiA (DUF1768 family)